MMSFLLIFMFTESQLSSSRSASTQDILDSVSFTENRHFNSATLQSFKDKVSLHTGSYKVTEVENWGERERSGVGSPSKPSGE